MRHPEARHGAHPSTLRSRRLPSAWLALLLTCAAASAAEAAEGPVTDMPVTDMPVTDVPVTDVPVTDAEVLPGAYETAPDTPQRLLEEAERATLNREYADALALIADAIERIEDDGGAWDQRKVPAHVALGDIYTDLGRHGEALEQYDEAVYLNRMNQGLHDPSQLSVLQRAARAHLELGDYKSANELQEYSYQIRERAADGDPVELLPALFDLAAWYRSMGNLFNARVLYEDAVTTIEQAYGPEDIRLIPALRGLAQTYRLERFPLAELTDTRQPQSRTDLYDATGAYQVNYGNYGNMGNYSSGERALQRAVEIYALHPEVPVSERADALTDLADWYLIFDKWTSALETYEEVRTLLLDSGVPETEVIALFAEPTPVIMTMPRPPDAPITDQPLRELRGFVDLEYTVSRRGRVEDVRVLGSQPEGLLDFRTRKAIRTARYRPRFEDAQAVDTANVRYRHEFVYFAPVESG